MRLEAKELRMDIERTDDNSTYRARTEMVYLLSQQRGSNLPYRYEYQHLIVALVRRVSSLHSPQSSTCAYIEDQFWILDGREE